MHRLIFPLGVLLAVVLSPSLFAGDSPQKPVQHWVWSTAHVLPKETTSHQSGYFSIVEGHNGKIYVGTAKYDQNAYLVEFDPATKAMKVVLDAHKEIGTNLRGFAAQSKFHTRNNVGRSGRIYLGTKQGTPKEGQKVSDYPGGYPMVFDPETGITRVYDIPVKHQGIISFTPDESRGVAYISTCSDERPVDSTHFMILDLASGKYRDLMDCQHQYAFIVVDHLGRAYHPIRGGDIARYDPATDRLERLKQTIDGMVPAADSLLADPHSHPVNWEVSPDRKTLYAVALNGNQLYAYDLTAEGEVLLGRSLGSLVAGAEGTDCRAMCVGADGTVWAGVVTTPLHRAFSHLVSYRPGASGPTDHGPIAISNPDYTNFTDAEGHPMAHHHGVHRAGGGPLMPRHGILGITASRDGAVYLTSLYPFTLHRLKIPQVAGVTTIYRHNSHSDVLLTRLMKTDTLDGKGLAGSVKLASITTDQIAENDLSRRFGKEHSVPIFESVAGALTLGTGHLAVDGVMLIAEHGHYPRSDTGQTIYPKRRLFGEVIEIFQKSDRVVPIFNDKHLADNWKDAKWMYDTAVEMKIPMMAGSSLPVLWRYPPTDVRRDARLEQIVALSYGGLDAYGFHALEMVQCLAERRAGGETGVKAVQCFSGDEVWVAQRNGVFDRQLLDQALLCLKQPIVTDRNVEDLPNPVLFVIDYEDGLRASVLHITTLETGWAAAWRYAQTQETDAALFWTQGGRPFMHFTYLLQGIEKMMHTGKPTWPVERTLLTSGVLNALLISRRDGGKEVKTPWLDVQYQSDWNWQVPPPPPTGPIHEQ